MENKLEQLTEKLYKEGLSKGEQEGQEILTKAQAEAKRIIDEANENARQLLSDADKKAEEIKQNAFSEIQLASRQIIEKVKQSIENLIVTKSIQTPTEKIFNETAFLKEIIKIAISNFKSNDSDINLKIIFPENKQEEYLSNIVKTMDTEFANGIEIKFDKNIRSGFRIGKSSDSYLVTFTAQDFENLFAHYLRKSIRTLLFNEKN